LTVEIVVGDLLDAKEDIIAHQVNSMRKMNSGVAKQIRNKYPSAYTDYMNMTENKKPHELLGKLIISNAGGNKYVAHLFGQLNYGYDGKRYTSYDALYDSLKQLKEQAKKANKTVAIPKLLGSDRGGADWDIVYKMIEKIFEDYKATIYKLEEN
jgi:O-acetyl-ADP-ribose deacetylase (regulator of RNase III)